MTYFGEFCYLNSPCIRKSITLMFMSSSRNKFTLLYQNSVADALLFSVRHVGAHPGGHQHGFSVQIYLNLGKTFFRISIQNIPLDRILARVFVYVPPFISQIPNLIYWTVLIFILIYFEWRDTENKQYATTSLKEKIFLFLIFARSTDKKERLTSLPRTQTPLNKRKFARRGRRDG